MRVAYQVIRRKKLADGTVKEYPTTKYYERKEPGEPRKKPERKSPLKPAPEIIEQVRAEINAGIKVKLILEKYGLKYYQVHKIASGVW